jgi:WD40 repeat protein
VWDVRSFSLRTTLTGHAGLVFSGAFSPDGRRVATASEDGTAKVWDAVEGRLLATFDGHRGDVYGVAFSPDGARLLTAGEDGTMQVWDVRALTQPWATLARQACVNLLGDKARRFSPAEVASDPLLTDEWGRADRDVCAGLPLAAAASSSGH